MVKVVYFTTNFKNLKKKRTNNNQHQSQQGKEKRRRPAKRNLPTRLWELKAKGVPRASLRLWAGQDGWEAAGLSRSPADSAATAQAQRQAVQTPFKHTRK